MLKNYFSFFGTTVFMLENTVTYVESFMKNLPM